MALSDWFPWIRHRLSIDSGGDNGVAFVDILPDDFLMEILSRLPSYDIHICRRVCKRWHILTSSAYFVEIQSNRAPTIIIGQVVQIDVFFSRVSYFSLDDKKDKSKLNKLKLKIGLNYPDGDDDPQLLYSFGGLLLLHSTQPLGGNYTGSYIVVNPITCKSRVISSPFCGYACGLFFNPSAIEFKILYVNIMRDDDISCWYYVYESTTYTWRKINTTPLYFRPTYMYEPIVVDMSLHWMNDLDLRAPKDQSVDPCLHAVVVFKISSEEIYTMPHPMVDGCSQHRTMVLFEMEKHLCLSRMIDDQVGGRMDIWELNDYENWSWIRRHIIRNIEVPNASTYFLSLRDRISRIFYVHKDILVINWWIYGLYLLDLTHSTVSRIHDSHIISERRWQLSFQLEDPGFHRFTTYTCSLLIPNV